MPAGVFRFCQKSLKELFFLKKNKKWRQGVMFFSQKSCMIDVSPGSKYVYEAILVNQ